MNNNLNNAISDIFSIYKRNYVDHKTKIGTLFIISNNNYLSEITLSRSYIRDKHLRNEGYKDFDEQAYLLNLNTILSCLPDIDSNKIANNIKLNFDSKTNQGTDNEINQEIIYDCDQINEIEDFNLDETQRVMAQMGFPTAFVSKKNFQINKNTKNVQKNDMKLIFSDIKQKMINLLENPNLIYQEIESLISSDSTFLDLDENELKAKLQRILSDYMHRKFIKWINKFDISDDYKSCTKSENPHYLIQLLNSVGLAYEASFELFETIFVYPLISVKSIQFSERNDLSFIKKFDDFNEDLFVGSDKENPMNKYYFQRYRYFDRFDQGILLDEESWYSVTPGALAEQVAQRYHRVFCNSMNNPVVIDAFCGAGGNAIRFAKYGFIVLAVDMDVQKLKLLVHNASIYEVDKKIIPICCDFYKLHELIQSGDCSDELRNLFMNALAVNISPPWGGPEYLDMDTYNVNFMEFNSLMKAALDLSPNISCFIPRHSNCCQIASWLTLNSVSNCKDNSIEIEQNCLQNKVKALTLYTGQLFQSIDLGLFIK